MAPDLPHAEVDEKQIYNVLYNLVNNAIPETPAGGQIWLRTLPAPPGEVPGFIVQVQDTGRGIPPAVLSRLFGDDAISTKPGGTGLGTRIVAGVVKRHGDTSTWKARSEKAPRSPSLFRCKPRAPSFSSYFQSPMRTKGAQ